MRWTRNTIAAAVFGGALILGSGAAAAGVLVASSHSAVIAVAPAAHAAPAKTTPAPVPTKTVTAPPAPVPTKTETAPPPAQPSARQPSSAPAAAPADSQFTNSVAVVTQYYQDITNHDYTDAWNLGGSNIAAQNGQTYDSWVTAMHYRLHLSRRPGQLEFRRSADEHQRGPVRRLDQHLLRHLLRHQRRHHQREHRADRLITMMRRLAARGPGLS